MSNIFDKCDLLSSLPDISKWNTSKVVEMNYMFKFCKRLKLLPDISKWITSHSFNMSELLRNYEAYRL